MKLHKMFYKDELAWGANNCIRVIDRIDNAMTLDVDCEKEIKRMYNETSGKGENPYVVNFISFCGHGLVINNDAHALIPVTP
jgi:hypothetical protein